MSAIDIVRRSRGRSAVATVAASALLALAGFGALAPARASDTTREQIYADIQKTLGAVPEFIDHIPTVALAGAWQEEKDLELSTTTALSVKEKALISLGVAAQIPCQYCIWADTLEAKQAGATDEEIGEAVAMSALTRHWSTLFNGLQIDFDRFKKDFGGDTAAAK